MTCYIFSLFTMNFKVRCNMAYVTFFLSSIAQPRKLADGEVSSMLSSWGNERTTVHGLHLQREDIVQLIQPLPHSPSTFHNG